MRAARTAPPPLLHAATSRAGTAAGRKCLVAARLTFSKASVSICRTRSPEIDSSRPRSSRLGGSSLSRRASNTRRSRAVEHLKGRTKRLRLLRAFILFDDDGFRVRRMIDQHRLPFSRPVIVDRRIQGNVARQTAAHLDHFAKRDRELKRDGLGHLLRQPCPVAAELVHGAPQAEEQLPLRRRRPDLDQRARPQDVIVDRRLDPPQRVGGKPGAAVGLKMRSRDDEAEIGFADQIGKRKVVSLVAARDLCRQPQMTGDERIGRVAVAIFLPAPGELLLAHRFKQSVSLDERGVFIDQCARSALAQHLAAF